jgi:hypothetical protein
MTLEGKADDRQLHQVADLELVRRLIEQRRQSLGRG